MVTSPLHPEDHYLHLSVGDSRLCVDGFLRKLVVLYKMVIPRDVQQLLFRFYCEYMPSFLIRGIGAVQYEELQIVRRSEATDEDEDIGKTYCISQIGWTSGIHEFKLKVLELPNESIGIGTVTNRDGFINFQSARDDWAHEWAFDSKACDQSYQIYYYNSTLLEKWYYDGIFVHDKGRELKNEKLQIDWNENDVIGFKINCDDPKLTFMINDQPVGETVDLRAVAFGDRYYPAVAFGGNNNVTLQYIIC